MMALMASVATTAFAQDALVKEAKKLANKGDFAAALQTIKPALTSAETTDKAAAYNQLSDIYFQFFNEEQKKSAEAKVKKEAFDEVPMQNAIISSMEAALKCDEFDAQPNEKGAVKPRFRAENGKRFIQNRINLIPAGQFFYKDKKDNATALKAWSMYVNSSEAPLFTGLDMTNDPYLSEIAYYTAFLAYQEKNFADATKYAQIAAKDPKKANEANEIVLFAMKDGAKTKDDSLAYLAYVKDLHAKNPEEERYFNLLLDYYNKPGRMNEMKAWTEEEIAKNDQNKMAWALKGEVEMNNQQWDNAIASYKKAAEIDPSFVQVIFNIGTCLNSKAIELKDKLADKKTGGLTTANANKVKAVLGEAKTYLEKAREVDPTREKVNWAYALYQVYYSLGDKAKSAEMEALLGNK